MQYWTIKDALEMGGTVQGAIRWILDQYRGKVTWDSFEVYKIILPWYEETEDNLARREIEDAIVGLLDYPDYAGDVVYFCGRLRLRSSIGKLTQLFLCPPDFLNPYERWCIADSLSNLKPHEHAEVFPRRAAEGDPGALLILATTSPADATMLLPHFLEAEQRGSGRCSEWGYKLGHNDSFEVAIDLVLNRLDTTQDEAALNLIRDQARYCTHEDYRHAVTALSALAKVAPEEVLDLIPKALESDVKFRRPCKSTWCPNTESIAWYAITSLWEKRRDDFQNLSNLLRIVTGRLKGSSVEGKKLLLEWLESSLAAHRLSRGGPLIGRKEMDSILKLFKSEMGLT